MVDLALGTAFQYTVYMCCSEQQLVMLSGNHFPMHLIGNVVFTLPGIYYHQCPVAPVTMANNSTEFRVVTAQHKVAICSSNNKITCTREMQVNVGDVVYWTTQFDNNTDCSGIVLVNAACSETSFRQYYQTATGKFTHTHMHSRIKLVTQVFSIFKYSSN